MNILKKLFGKKQEEIPVPTPPPPPPPPEPEPRHINEVDSAELDAMLKQNEAVSVIDLRMVWEYQSGHIPSAMNIPIMYLDDKLDEVPKTGKVVLQCYHGFTSLDAAGYLIENGWQDDAVFSLSGGMSGWVTTFGMEALVRADEAPAQGGNESAS